jgi:site-specific DNA-methyltransferase (adenine-specific)
MTEAVEKENVESLSKFDNWREKFLDKILRGDSAILLKEIPPEQISLVVTSPPYYKQRDYGGGIGNERTVEEYLDNVLKVFHECVRVVRQDGSIVFNLGDKYENGSLLLVPYRFAIEALKREPVKLINNITWVKLNPTPRQFNRRLVSSTEPFFHFVKSNSYYYNIKAFMESLSKSENRTKSSEKLGRKYFQLIERAPLSAIEREKAREELQKVIREVSEGKIAGFRMKIRGIHAPAFGGQEGGRKIQMEKQGFTIIRIHGNSLKRDVIECPVETIEGCKHPAIYPEFIVQELIKLLTRPGDIVLDPFVGSGTTAVAAKKLGRHFIGIDINPDYCKYAEDRVNKVNKQIAITDFI